MDRRLLTACARPQVAALVILACVAPPSESRAAEASPWVKNAQSEARLIAGGRDAGTVLAGLEVRLEPRFITYWRDPGDAGVPPTFSFAGSENVRSVAVRYPAPKSLDEAGAKAFGYEDDVIFPLLVVPEDPSKPVGLAVTLDYAVCHEVCLPAHADLHLTLDGKPSAEAGRVRDALAAVPRPATVGSAGDSPSVVKATPDGNGGFTVLAEGAAGGTLFVEAPEGWSYEAGAPQPQGTGRTMFPVKRLDHPKGAERPPGPLTLTLTAPTGAVEVPVLLDAAVPKP